MRKKVDQVKRNKMALLRQYAMVYAAEGLKDKELDDKLKELKKRLGL